MTVESHLPEEYYALREQIARLEEKLVARDVALNLATDTLKAWQTNSNEWRGALSDNNNRFCTSDEVRALIAKEEAKREALVAVVSSLERSRSEASGKSSGFNASWGIALGVAGFMCIALEVYALLKR